MTRVLHLINGEYFGGSARVLMNYLESSERTSDVAVGIMFAGELERRVRALGVRTEVVPMRSRLDALAFRHVVRLARRFHADAIHTHQVRNTLLGRLASAADGLPVVTHVHSPVARESTHAVRNFTTNTVDRMLARRTRRFIAVSRSLRDELVRQGTPADRVRVVHNGIPPPPILPLGEREVGRTALGATPTDLLIGMVANFRPRKGTEVLIDAVAHLVSAGRPIRLALIGEPFREPGRDYGEQLVARARERGISDHLTMTGFRADASALIGVLDVLSLPSLFGEGLPMVLLEAMAAQVPIVSTPVEGIGELVTDGENGLLVPPGDVAALAAALDRVLMNHDERRHLGRAGRETIERGFTASRMAAGFEAVYRELLD
jgi:glycosyltransferase involved in cell wall biosynthesis